MSARVNFLVPNVILLFWLLFSATLAAQNYPLDTILMNGPVSNRINIVILGDGYREEELPKFKNDVHKISEDLMKEEPFKSYANFFNIWSVSVSSNESGAANDPSQLIDNYFGSTFNVSGIQRLLVPMRSWRISQVLAEHFPVYDQVIMLVNDSRYGGSGGWIATSSTHSSAGEIAIHEIGHSFSRLSDEYYAGEVYLRETPNMTRETDPQKVKWKNWMGFQGVGIFQHCCGGSSNQWYRPHENCKMRFLGRPFCRVCAETTVERIYQLIDPIDSFFPDTSQVLEYEEEVLFFVSPIKPNPNSLEVNWILNDSILAIQSDTFLWQSSLYPEAKFRLAYTLTDTTHWVRNDQFQQRVFKRLSWQIERNTTSVDIRPFMETWTLSLFPNPASTVIYIKSPQLLTGTVNVQILSMSGLLLVNQAFQLLDQDLVQVHLDDLMQGHYLLRMTLEGQLLWQQKLLIAK